MGRRDVGEKPTMWEAWVGKDREKLEVHEEKEEVNDEKEAVWDGILVGFSSSISSVRVINTISRCITADLSNLPQPPLQHLQA